MSGDDTNGIFEWLKSTLLGDTRGVTPEDQKLINEEMISLVHSQERAGRISESARTFEKHWPGYNYLGPGTNIESKLANVPGVGSIVPVNELDAIAFRHDILYRLYDPAVRQLADNEMVQAIDAMDYQTADARFARLMILTKIKLEQVLNINLGVELSGDPDVKNSTEQVENAKSIADLFLTRLKDAGVYIPGEGRNTTLEGLDASEFASIMSDVAQLASGKISGENQSFSIGSTTVTGMSEPVFIKSDFQTTDDWDTAVQAEMVRRAAEVIRAVPSMSKDTLSAHMTNTIFVPGLMRMFPDLENLQGVWRNIMASISALEIIKPNVSLIEHLEALSSSLDLQPIVLPDGSAMDYNSYKQSAIDRGGGGGGGPDPLPVPRSRPDPLQVPPPRPGPILEEKEGEEKKSTPPVQTPPLHPKYELDNFIRYLEGQGITDDEDFIELMTQSDVDGLRAELLDYAEVIRDRGDVFSSSELNIDSVLHSLSTPINLAHALQGSNLAKEYFPNLDRVYTERADSAREEAKADEQPQVDYGEDVDRQIQFEAEGGLLNYNTTDTFRRDEGDHFHSLLPFLPIAGTDIFDEQTTVEADKLKQQNLLIGQYRPPNWPLGNVDNPIWLGNLKNQGLKWSGKAFDMPPSFKGGSLTDGAKMYGSYTKRPKIRNTDRYGPYNRM
jgi:hypothetical protein